jgi:CheY-like chemotaxis protein
MQSASSTRTHVPARILLVDDNHDGVLARRSILEELGYQVVPASSGSDALQRAEENNFDLVITDFRMTPMNGLQLISELRRRGFTNPVILLSGFIESLGLSKDESGADIVIQKCANEIMTLTRHVKRLLAPQRKPASSQRTSRRSTAPRKSGTH